MTLLLLYNALNDSNADFTPSDPMIFSTRTFKIPPGDMKQNKYSRSIQTIHYNTLLLGQATNMLYYPPYHKDNF